MVQYHKKGILNFYLMLILYLLHIQNISKLDTSCFLEHHIFFWDLLANIQSITTFAAESWQSGRLR